MEAKVIKENFWKTGVNGDFLCNNHMVLESN